MPLPAWADIIVCRKVQRLSGPSDHGSLHLAFRSGSAVPNISGAEPFPRRDFRRRYSTLLSAMLAIRGGSDFRPSPTCQSLGLDQPEVESLEVRGERLAVANVTWLDVAQTLAAVP